MPTWAINFLDPIPCKNEKFRPDLLLRHIRPVPIDHFGTYISARVISARMSHQGNISAHASFGAADVPANGLFNTRMFRHGEFSARGIFGMRNFRHLNISAQGYFGTWTFWHMDILAPCKAIWTFRHRHFGTCATLPKCPHAEIFLCWKFLVPKIPHAEKSPGWNVPVLKCPSARTYAAPNGARAKMFPWWNICAEMTLAEMFHATMVYRLTFITVIDTI